MIVKYRTEKPRPSSRDLASYMGTQCNCICILILDQNCEEYNTKKLFILKDCYFYRQINDRICQTVKE